MPRHAVAVFKTRRVKGEAVASKGPNRTMKLRVRFTRLPRGAHGFHIHKAGDLRGEGCKGACDHYHVGRPMPHGGLHSKKRHTGDLGNVRGPTFKRTYTLRNITPQDVWGRSLIVHEDEDDLGKGHHTDSKTTGHSGARIACAIFGRA
jgi:Cu-Zn family superoxide dismutase